MKSKPSTLPERSRGPMMLKLTVLERRQLRIVSALTGKTMQDCVTEALNLWLETKCPIDKATIAKLLKSAAR